MAKNKVGKSLKVPYTYIVNIKQNPTNGLCKVYRYKVIKDTNNYVSKKLIAKKLPLQEAENLKFRLERGLTK